MPHWLPHALGLDNVAGYVYAFWSGSGSVFIPPILSGVVVGALFWWHHQCHVTGCYWYARRVTAAGERACWKHHPHGRRTARDIHAAHAAAVAVREPEPPADLAALLAEVRGLRADVSGATETVRSVLLAQRQGGRRGQ